MDDGRLRGDGRLGDDFSGGWSERDDGREDWTSFRDRVDREWRSRRAQGSDDDPVSPDEASRWLTDSNAGQGPADFSVSDYRERLLGGPGAELFGGGSGPLYDSGEFAKFSFDKEEERRAAAAADPLAAALPQQAQNEYVDEPYTTDVESSGLVRPYFRTRGRTKPTYDLAIEALISTSEQGRVLDRVRVPEHRSICDLCLDTRSVAEVAALLRLPLGVVRVLIGDVAGLGLVLVHTASQNVGDRPSIEFMERVLSGLRRI
ncbi:DUF742 domain-containing protein [Amycolatopsis orientalis]|uniref:DUF742 domain-containing protein n=1 Tax=Amycolatopsis orientalis TaxID=31958 RepID=A0A193BRQ2_AMYOR|nr:DUF742 domain-containing protein [Amycolatopsis orientalis]ANN14877.1 hypothetical protein SD37_03880 [Amycolatopsis orientalis]